MKVKCTRSRCLLEGCVKDSYYARFHLHSYHCCREMNFISRLDANFQTRHKILTKSLEREMKVKGTGSRCLLEECVKDNYYARFYPHSYHCCKEMKFIPRLDVNFLDSTQIVDGRTDEQRDERTESLTPISHLAKSRCDKKERKHTLIDEWNFKTCMPLFTPLDT